MAPAPFGAAVRHDRYKPWKIAVLGDPMFTLGPRAPRFKDVPPDLLDPLTDVGEHSMRDLILRADDEGASIRLLEHSMAGTLTPDEARDGAPALFRTGRLQELEQAFRVMRADDRVALADYAWLASRRPSVDLSHVLKDLLRPGQIALDAVELSKRLPRGEAITLLSDARARVRREADLTLIDQALREVR
ncbi:MAG: hypothetical protein KDA28_16755, partial [Phycisphaerales bacterium]|nr:hypothetical protein [Phycisphaerales bacterium]